MIFYLQNYFDNNRVKHFNGSSIKTLEYLLETQPNLVCLNYKVKKLAYEIYAYHNRLKKYKTIRYIILCEYGMEQYYDTDFFHKI